MIAHTYPGAVWPIEVVWAALAGVILVAVVFAWEEWRPRR